MGRSQGGNNNAYCQDNAASWMNWSPTGAGRSFGSWERFVLMRFLRYKTPNRLNSPNAEGRPLDEG